MAFSIGGMRVRASPWLLLLPVVPVATGLGTGVLLCLFLLLAHELAHLLAASAVGMEVEELEILPLGARITLHGLNRDPAAEVLVSLAGPVHNLLLLALALALSGMTAVSPAGLRLFTGANLALALFNILPFPPLDGGRALLALAGSAAGRRRTARLLVRVGVVFAVMLLLASVAGPAVGIGAGSAVLTGSLGLALLVAVASEPGRADPVRDPVLHLLRRRGERQRPTRTVVISAPPRATVAEIARSMSPGRSYLVWVVHPDGRAAGPLTEDHLLDGLMKHGWSVTLGDLAGGCRV